MRLTLKIVNSYITAFKAPKDLQSFVHFIYFMMGTREPSAIKDLQSFVFLKLPHDRYIIDYFIIHIYINT